MSDPLDDLDINLDDVDVSRPVLPPDVYELAITDARVESGKNNPANRNLVVVFSTTQVHTATNGTEVQPNFPIYKYYPLQQSDKPKARDFRQDLAKLTLAVFSERRPINAETINDLKGRHVLATLKVRNDDDYGPSNEISSLKPVE